VAISGIVGFSAGGPVSMRQLGDRNHYVTCELSLYPEQVISSEGLKYELLSRLDLNEADSHHLLTALGGLTLEERLGSRHTVDISAILPAAKIGAVKLQLHSRCTISDAEYGIYEVNAA